MTVDNGAVRDLLVDVAGQGTVGARLYPAAAATAPVLALAHGAGASQDSAFMVAAARGLAALGVSTVTFNFPYTEAARRVPDRAPVLEATWRAVIHHLLERQLARAGALVIGGKSMGGRMASQVLAATGSCPPGVAGLVLLGYPLHPPDRPQQLRVAHLPALATPTLVVHGTRDPFGSIDEVRRAFDSAPAPVEWFVVEGGDHSFTVPRGAPRASRQVFDDILHTVAAWVHATTRGTGTA